MDSFVALALVGTAHQTQVHPSTGTPVDELLTGLPACENERRLLLSAGSWAVYLRAGQQPLQIDDLPLPAAAEKLRPCSQAAALFLSRLVDGEHAALLPEALARLHKVGAHVPHHLLPLLLNKREKEVRSALFPVLGERGLWLSSFNSAWRWVQDFLPGDENNLPDDAAMIWQEGTPAQRTEILRRLRAIDSTKAREWLADSWKQERAEVRASFLAAIEIGLNADDEELLESSLNDRSSAVRTVAANLLSRLPDSVLSRRMIERGTTMLQMNKDHLRLVFPAKLEETWLRDGIVENPPKKFGQRAWWLVQVLGSIPPTFWETHFALGPETLLELASKNKWGLNIIDGWSKAAITYQTESWIMPLWNCWQERYKKPREEQITDPLMREKLLRCMPGDQAEKVVLDLLQEQRQQEADEWASFLSELPQPWSEIFGFGIVRTLRTQYSAFLAEEQHIHPYHNPWFSNLSTIAQALPAACLREAARAWDLPEEGANWQINYVCQLLKTFVETAQMRLKIYEELV